MSKEIDDILGDVFEILDDADSQPEIIIENEVQTPNIKKFDKLMDAFEIGEGKMSENINKIQTEMFEEYKTIENKISIEENLSIVNIPDLVADHNLVRESLREDIKHTRIVLEALSKQISTSDIEDLSGSVTEAYSSIKSAQVKSLKLLMDSYNIISDTQLKIKKLTEKLKEINTEEKNTTIEKAIFIGSPQDLLETLGKD